MDYTHHHRRCHHRRYHHSYHRHDHRRHCSNPHHPHNKTHARPKT